MKTFYEILEISEKASTEVMEKAYKVLAKKYHPDLQTTDAQKKIAEEKMKQINEAYDMLSNPTKRQEYDNEIEHSREQEQQRQTTSQQRDTPSYQPPQPQEQPKTYYEPDTAEYEKQARNSAKEAYKEQEKWRKRYEREYNKELFKLQVLEKVKKIRDLAITIAIMAVLFFIIWKIPFTHKWLVDFYEGNPIIKSIVDVILNMFR